MTIFILFYEKYHLVNKIITNLNKFDHNIISMFQNSFFNCAQIACPYHKNSLVTHICLQHRCTEQPFLCQQCLSTFSYKSYHYNHEAKVVPLIRGLQMISKEIQSTKKPLQQMYMKLLKDKGSENLLRWQQDKQHHYNSLHNNIQYIKNLLNQQIQEILGRFSKYLYEQKQSIEKQLQSFEIEYKQKLEQFSKFTQPVAAMSTTYKYCSNKNVIMLKIASESDENNNKQWFNNMKRTVRDSQKINQNIELYFDKIKNLSETTNNLMDQLPRIRDHEYEQYMNTKAPQLVKEVLRTFVKVGTVPNGTISEFQRTYSNTTDKSSNYQF